MVRRGRTLKLAALQRNGITGPEEVARIAAAGIGRQGRAKGGKGLGLGRSKVGGKHRPSLAGAWTLMARG